jgi:hypothetical protein
MIIGPGAFPCFKQVATIVLVLGALIASPSVRADLPPPSAGESLDSAMCRFIESAAARYGVRRDLLTRLIWRESAFDAGAVSPKGAQGVAQFMPGTASDRGLADPFDPEAAIPAAAHLIADLTRDFGNVGLASAAYNAGPDRVSRWLAGRSTLPLETEEYVPAVTGRSADDWAADQRVAAFHAEAAEFKPDPPCLTLTAGLRKGTAPTYSSMALSPLAPWGVQVAGNFSKARALKSFAAERKRYSAVLGSIRPMIIGTRLRSRGTRAFYRVRAPAASRKEAENLCRRVHNAGGSCIVLKS